VPGSETDRPTLAIAGASGFVGTHLIEALRRRYRIVALTRSDVETGDGEADAIEWRRCDLFEVDEVERALEGVEIALYLVHSMLPTSRLTQARFEDLDLLLADNFSRAASKAGVQRIIYLGGLSPEGPKLSRHLRSRLEVGRCLAARDVPVTTLKAGLILGPGGSSLNMLVTLVHRIPLMILPRWTESRTQAAAVWDVVRAFERILDEPASAGASFDFGHPQILTYRDMIQKTASVLGLKRSMIGVPLRAPELSSLWCQLFSGSPRALVRPLIESLRHDLLVKPNPLVEEFGPSMISFEEALKRSLDECGRLLPSPRLPYERRHRAAIRRASRVRAVRRCRVPADWSPLKVVQEYFCWIDRRGLGMFKIESPAKDRIALCWRWPRWNLLELTYDPAVSDDLRAAYRLTGGLLVGPDEGRPGWLEVRRLPHEATLFFTIHDYAPALPWYLYVNTQALLHDVITRAFARHLKRRSREETASS